MPAPNKYPPEFRRDVVELVRSSGKTIAQVAKELGLNRETVRCWSAATRPTVASGLTCSARRSGKSWPGCGGRTPSCGWSGRS